MAFAAWWLERPWLVLDVWLPALLVVIAIGVGAASPVAVVTAPTGAGWVLLLITLGIGPTAHLPQPRRYHQCLGAGDRAGVALAGIDALRRTTSPAAAAAKRQRTGAVAGAALAGAHAESLIARLGACGVWWSGRRRCPPGQTAAMVLLGYGSWRALAELLRADNPSALFGLSASFLMSILIILLAMASYYAGSHDARQSEENGDAGDNEAADDQPSIVSSMPELASARPQKRQCMMMMIVRRL